MRPQLRLVPKDLTPQICELIEQLEGELNLVEPISRSMYGTKERLLCWYLDFEEAQIRIIYDPLRQFNGRQGIHVHGLPGNGRELANAEIADALKDGFDTIWIHD